MDEIKDKCDEVKKEWSLKRFIIEKIYLRILKGILNTLDRIVEREKEDFMMRYHVAFMWIIAVILYCIIKSSLK